MSQTDDSESVMPTEHPHVFYESLRFDRGEFEKSVAIADSIDEEWDVHITIAPYRPYNIQYGLDIESRVVWLDFYSVRPTEGYDIKDVISDIRQGIEDAS